MASPCSKGTVSKLVLTLTVRMFDKVMIVLSEASGQSRWVEREVNAARDREDRDNCTHARTVAPAHGVWLIQDRFSASGTGQQRVHRYARPHPWAEIGRKA